MTTFLTDLWESVFTSGPTPSLLLATNVSFGGLQILLFALLLATYSIHFIVLSVLCGGLWWSINWFAGEVGAVRAEEEKKRREVLAGKGKGVDGDEGDDEGESTEVEDDGAGRSMVDVSKKPRTTGTSGLEVPSIPDTLQRVMPRSMSGTDVSERSTDSEWEKVDGER